MSTTTTPAVEAFLAAIKAQDAPRVTALLAANPALAAARDETGLSALLWTVYTRQEELTGRLRALRGELDLFEAAATGELARVQALLEADPSAIEALAPDGFRALHLASFFGHAPVVAWLLARGAGVNAVAQNSSGVQPLHSAAAGNHEAVVRLLLEAGADPNAIHQGKYTPLMAARFTENAAIEALLIAHGATG